MTVASALGYAGDRRLIEKQLGRAPRGLAGVVVRCPHGFPAVIETRPYLEDGSPFPTLFYLTCPSAVAAVSRVEEAGGVVEFRGRVGTDPVIRSALARLEDSCRQRRAAMVAPDSLSAASDRGAVLQAGIGGPQGAEKATCLHAYVAALLAARAGRLELRAAVDAPDPADPAPDLPTAASDGTAGPVDESAEEGGSAALREVWEELLRPFADLWCDDRACERLISDRHRAAAVDVGTNSVRLLVADLPARRPETVLRRAEVTRLGEALAAGGRLRPEARERTKAVVARYVQEARSLGAVDTTIVGTSATRDAADGGEFMEELGREIGVKSTVLTGRLEALLSYVGAAIDFPGAAVFVDVGGGSTELVRLGEDGRLWAESLDIGCVRTAERWMKTNPPLAVEQAAIRDEARRAASSRREIYAGASTLMGAGGTITTLACLVHKLEVFDSSQIHLSTVTRAGLEEQVGNLALMTHSDIARLPCIQPGRETVIVAGGEIVLGIMEALGYDEMRVSERDILDGVILAAEDTIDTLGLKTP